MSNNTMSHSDLIDGLVRQLFGVEPSVMAALAHGDEQVRLRRLPIETPTIDPLDGVELFLRRVIAAAIAMRRHYDAVNLVTDDQARKAGWPCAKLANLCLVLAWTLLAEFELAYAVPLLFEADGAASNRSTSLIQIGQLPPLEKLHNTFFGANRVDTAAMGRAAQARDTVPLTPGRVLVSLDRYLKSWLRVDADDVELRSEKHGRSVFNRNARAAIFLPMVVMEAVEIGRVLQEESIPAVRLKTDRDALYAKMPRSCCNFALLLGVAISHGTGYTAHVLPANESVADALEDHGKRFRGTQDLTGDDEAVERLELEDVARRGYVHVGRRAARRIAQRLYDHLTEPGVHNEEPPYAALL